MTACTQAAHMNKLTGSVAVCTQPVQVQAGENPSVAKGKAHEITP